MCLGYLFLLRNILGVGNLICNLQIEVQVDLWVWEPKTKDLEKRGHEDGCHQPRQMETEPEGELGKEECETLACLDCEGIKTQRFLWNLSSEESAQAVSALLQLYGMRHLRLCFGKPGIELVKKPGLCECGSPVGTCQVTGATTVEGLWSQQ